MSSAPLSPRDSIVKALNPALCETCIQITIPKLRTGFHHHENEKQLRNSARRCPLCSIIAKCLRKDPEPGPDVDLDERIWIEGIGYPDGGLHQANVFSNDSEGRIRLFADTDDPAADAIYGRPIRDHGACSKNFDLARKWLTTCASTHPECSFSGDMTLANPVMPTRVIDVDGECGPRVIHTAGGRGKWIALSHCWGSEPIVRLTEESRDCLLEKIPMDKLPQTFRDAIWITRELGIRYIWIDSLCIFQDSKIDWQNECTHMPIIYSEAYLVLAANATPSSLGGVLLPREVSDVHTMDFGLNGTVSFGLLFENQTPDYLGKRAWCFQENYLGHRRLEYYQTHMEYSCGKQRLTEHEYVQRPSPQQKKPVPSRKLYIKPGSLDIMSRRGRGYVTEEERTAIYKYWANAVSEYSRRELTREDDKLSALSGLADQVEQCIEDQYIAGLWRQTLLQSLLWRAVGRDPLRRTKMYRAPSWSWASVDGYIDFSFDPEISSVCEILKVHATPAGIDPFGQVRDGFLQIRAPMKKALIGEKTVTKVYHGFRTRIALLDPEGTDSVGNDANCIFDETELIEGETVWCLQIQESRPEGLLLQRVSAYSMEYRRIGTFYLNDISGRDFVPTWFEGCERHTVTIV